MIEALVVLGNDVEIDEFGLVLSLTTGLELAVVAGPRFRARSLDDLAGIETTEVAPSTQPVTVTVNGLMPLAGFERVPMRQPSPVTTKSDAVRLPGVRASLTATE
jgi:hypothetical protein